jgi:hypothetical protein
MIICPNCEQQLLSSDYYTVRDSENIVARCGKCNGPFDPLLIYYNGSTAKKFDPIVLHVSNEDPNQISFPGRSDEAVAEGYHKVEITNLREADQWTSRINHYEKGVTEGYRQSEKQYWDEVTAQRRADIRARIGDNPKAKALFEQVQKFVDAKRARRYSKKLDPRGHFQVIAYDSSNRMSHCDVTTGWKEKKA